MEGNPHRIIEGALIAAYAAGADSVVIYVNAEADLSAERLSAAVADAQAAGLFGPNALGSEFGCAVEVRRGAGGYVCGEETTLLNTIEGRRREPRLRPPFPTDAGLFGEPTVINNAETLCNVPAILTGGVRRFRINRIERGQGYAPGVPQRRGAAARFGGGSHRHDSAAGDRTMWAAAFLMEATSGSPWWAGRPAASCRRRSWMFRCARGCCTPAAW